MQHEAGIFPWEEFCRALIAQVARAEAAESAYAFEYGERDDVY